ncbi:hypothetical protein HDF12_000963 [Edaphobacter lichenicola]|uniref:Uncharacterized protein n=2 Tax=Tunturiibacter TaxID=3154218 RepID=A0A7Y9NJS2_9BACT|nr:hypothetical protein [Edaphobacter lichenicola]NYF50598.1 hypothetical protein [Edaphobacter lichenicola]
MHYLNQTYGQIKKSKTSHRALHDPEMRPTPISNHDAWPFLS